MSSLRAIRAKSRARVLVVDDSVVMRGILSSALRRIPDFEVVGTASNGRIAVEKANELERDLPSIPARDMMKPASAEDYRFIQNYVYTESGIVIESVNQYLIEARLGPLLKTGMQNLGDLCRLLRSVRKGAIGQDVVNVITTNETFFFRDPAQYDALRSRVLPKLVEAHRRTRRLRFWSAACSTGQEAYSLAMVLQELSLRAWDVRILATDLNAAVIEKAPRRRLCCKRSLPGAKRLAPEQVLPAC